MKEAWNTSLKEQCSLKLCNVVSWNDYHIECYLCQLFFCNFFHYFVQKKKKAQINVDDFAQEQRYYQGINSTIFDFKGRIHHVLCIISMVLK